MEKKYICPACQAENEPEALLCRECGASLTVSKEQICSACGASLKEDLQFCTQCGAPLQKEESFNYSLEVASPKKPAPVKRQKTAVSLYAVLSYVSFGIAALFFFIGIISLLTLSATPVTGMSAFFSSTDNSSLLIQMASCLFMVISSLIFTVLGSGLLLLIPRKKKK